MNAQNDKGESPSLLVTGASSGIGAAVARRFAHQGYRVALAARRMDRLQAMAKEVAALGGQALPVEADVSWLADIKRMTGLVIEQFGAIDVLVNNAGFGRLDWLEDLQPEEDVQAQLEVNLLGLIWTTQAALPHMIARRRGHIINIGSMAGYVATPTYSIYAASKFGVRGFTDALRRELRIYGIHVSGVYPGAVETEFSERAKIHRKSGYTTPGRLRLSADQVADAVWSLVRRPRRQVIQPGVMRLAVLFNALFPGMVDSAVERLFVRGERK